MKMMMMAKHNGGLSLITEDIMSEIFLWLPLQSLVRFKSLSKRWYFLITHNDSDFRRNYLSTLSKRRRNRIVGSYDFHPIMPGFFYQSTPPYMRTYDRIRFLTNTSTSTSTTTSSSNTQLMISNPFSSLDESFDKFLSCCLHRDPAHQNIYIAASSNGFILCSFEINYPERYCLVNPVTMEWLALPVVETNTKPVVVGFVCKGDYPSLDFVDYTIVRSSWLDQDVNLLFEFFSSGDNEWRDYICSCESLESFSMLDGHNPVIVMNASTTTTTDSDHHQGGAGGIVVYLLVMLSSNMASAIIVFDSNKGEDSLQMIETPGPLPGRSAFACDDYIREFDGVIHYVRFRYLTKFEFWVLNIESREWCLKHRASLKTMMEGYPWTDVGQYNVPSEVYHIHGFHPMNPNLIFLTLYTRMVCYNIETGTLELVRDFFAQNMLDDYNHHVYQWPCWPPLI